MPSAKSQDTFLADAVHGKPKRISYQDGFRFGVGFFIGNLLLLVVLGGLGYGLAMAFHLK